MKRFSPRGASMTSSQSSAVVRGSLPPDVGAASVSLLRMRCREGLQSNCLPAGDSVLFELLVMRKIWSLLDVGVSRRPTTMYRWKKPEIFEPPNSCLHSVCSTMLPLSSRKGSWLRVK